MATIRKKLMCATLALGIASTGLGFFTANASSNEMISKEGIKELQDGVEYSGEYVSSLSNSRELTATKRYWHGSHYSSVGIFTLKSEYLPLNVRRGQGIAIGANTVYGKWTLKGYWSRAHAKTNYSGTNYTKFKYQQ